MATMFIVLALCAVLGWASPIQEVRATATLSIGTGVPVNMALFGLNEVLGPGRTMPYNNPSVCEAVQSLRAGLLRYPGGTVANYWNYTYGEYVHPCPFTKDCVHAKNVSSFPKGTFSPAAFSKGVASCTTAKGAVLWDLNVYTANTGLMNEQLAILADEHLPTPVLEFGNELYLGRYNTGSDPYMNKIHPIITTARSTLPKAQIAVIADFDGLMQGSSAWNEGIARHSSLFDAVTLHDYYLSSESVSHLSSTQQVGYTMAFSDAAVQASCERVKRMFGESKTLMFTEFNYAVNNIGPLPHLHQGAVHGIYWASRVLAAVNSGGSVSALTFEALGGPYAGGKPTGYAIYGAPSQQPKSLEGSIVSGVGQIFAHLADVGKRASTMHPITITAAPSTKFGPIFGIHMDCLQAAAFSGAAGTDVIVVNRCGSDIAVSISSSALPVPSLSGSGSAGLIMTTYNATDAGGWVQMPPASASLPWSKPLKAQVTKGVAITSDGALSASIPGLSMNILSM